MSEIALQNALARRERLLRELEKLDAFIHLYHELNEPSPSGKPSVAIGQHGKVHVHIDPQEPTSPRIRPRHLPPIVREILLENKRPMTRFQLIEALKKRKLQCPRQMRRDTLAPFFGVSEMNS